MEGSSFRSLTGKTLLLYIGDEAGDTGTMAKLSTPDIKKELLHLRKRFSHVEEMLEASDPAADRKQTEIDLNSIVSELTYSLITSNATLAGIADIVLNYAKVFTRSEYGYVHCDGSEQCSPHDGI